LQTAGKEDKAASTSYQHGEELDLARVQASTSLTATRYVHRRYQLNFFGIDNFYWKLNAGKINN
jgi:hypothetical protein